MRGWAPEIEISPTASVADLALYVERARISLWFHVPEHLRDAVLDHINGNVSEWHYFSIGAQPGSGVAQIEAWAMRLYRGEAGLAELVIAGLSTQQIADAFDRSEALREAGHGEG